MEKSMNRAVAMVFLGMLLLVQMSSYQVKADCTIKNNSKEAIIVVPVDVTVKVNIEVAAGASVAVPPSHQHCQLRNKATHHVSKPVTLPDHRTVVVVDGDVSGTVNVYVASLLSGILRLGAAICISL